MKENYKFAETDYKAGSEDVLYALQETFRDEVPELDSDVMISLAENYSMEQTLDVIKAFGQELSKSYLLFTVEDDSDSYVMTIIPRDEEDAFVSKMKESKRKATLMLQPRKKAGSPAKRFDFGKQIKGMGATPTFLLGARTASDLVELDAYRSLGPVYITTEDGSMGEKGFVTQHSVLKQSCEEGRASSAERDSINGSDKCFDRISTCGPKPMMVAVARYAAQHAIDCEASLENLMACGLGACLCCVEKTSDGNVCVCKEGPVFNINRLLWQD